MTSACFYPGSFDPVTNGHLGIIERALKLFSPVVVGIGVHASKEPMLDAETRVRLIEEVAGQAAVSAGSEIRIATFDGLVVDAAREAGAAAVIRGLRDASDFAYEMRMAHMNRSMAGEIETVFLAADPASAFISSTLVRQIASMGGDISQFVPPASARAVAAALGR